MNETVEYKLAEKIMGSNFVGIEELKKVKQMKLLLPTNCPLIPFTEEVLKQKSHDYILILCVDKFTNNKNVTIRNIKEIYGKNPDMFEPCFYNQDWYDCENFIDQPVEAGWKFIRKNIYEESRGVPPNQLMLQFSFPTAVLCTYTFFAVWESLGIKLWYHDFIWCKDMDHNGDRIYVGKYHDVDGVNKNGFSIHRHLELRPCYACID